MYAILKFRVINLLLSLSVYLYFSYKTLYACKKVPSLEFCLKYFKVKFLKFFRGSYKYKLIKTQNSCTIHSS